MVRPRKNRVVEFEPNITYFKPTGIPLKELDEVQLSIEELEALRLEFLEKNKYSDSAKKMKVSRATFSRILHSAGKKLAEALVNGKAIRIEGGSYSLKKGGNIMPRGFGRGRGQGQGFGLGPGGYCVCPSCGEKVQHIRGTPCYNQKCPKCGSPMTRER